MRNEPAATTKIFIFPRQLNSSRAHIPKVSTYLHICHNNIVGLRGKQEGSIGVVDIVSLIADYNSFFFIF